MKRRYRTQVCGPEAGRRHVAWVKDVRAGRMLVATVSANPDEGTRYMAVDHLGTPRLVTDACAVTRAQHTYYPFGFEATSSTQDSEAMKFTGHERDLQGTYGSQTDDLDYMHARHYSPGLARFLVPDALRGDRRRPQTFNLFAYVTGNPSTYSDPWGMEEYRFKEDITVTGQWPSWMLDYMFFLIQTGGTPGGVGGVTGDGGGGVGGGGGDPASEGAESKRCTTVRAERNIDYGSIAGVLPVLTQWTGGLLGATLVITVDRNGDVYVAGGLSLGRSAGPLPSLTFALGGMDSRLNPSPSQLQGHLSGVTLSFTGGMLNTIGRSWSPGANSRSWEMGWGTPQFGVSATGAARLGNLNYLLRGGC